MRNPRTRPHDGAPHMGFSHDYPADASLLDLDRGLSLGPSRRPLVGTMTAPEKLYTPMGDAETRMQIVPLEELLAERDEIVAQLSRLRAVYSNGGTFDALRKIELSKAANLVRAQATLENKRVTESYLDEMAHVADAYVDFIVQATSE